ncbi:hypothetical protein [Pseudomonas sp.]|uniref:hypothetical protein n=1 Tax=Pseudomonas sp. TaxID=306 RepID=UPI003F3F7BA2
MNDRQEDDFRSRNFPVNEDMAFQRKVWRFERVGWYALVLIVLLTLAGLFSKGPLSSRALVSPDQKLMIEHELFHRSGSTSSMVIHVQANPHQTVELQITGDFLQGFSIDTLQPDPLRSSTADQGIKWWLQADAAGKSTLYLTVRSDGLGLYESQVVTPGAKALKVTQFIYP